MIPGLILFSSLDIFLTKNVEIKENNQPLLDGKLSYDVLATTCALLRLFIILKDLIEREWLKLQDNLDDLTSETDEESELESDEFEESASNNSYPIQNVISFCMGSSRTFYTFVVILSA